MAREIMASAMRDENNIIRRRREKIGTRRGEEENAGEKNRLPQNPVLLNHAPKTFRIDLI